MFPDRQLAAQEPFADMESARAETVKHCLSDYQRSLPEDHPSEARACYKSSQQYVEDARLVRILDELLARTNRPLNRQPIATGKLMACKVPSLVSATAVRGMSWIKRKPSA